MLVVYHNKEKEKEKQSPARSPSTSLEKKVSTHKGFCARYRGEQTFDKKGGRATESKGWLK